MSDPAPWRQGSHPSSPDGGIPAPPPPPPPCGAPPPPPPPGPGGLIPGMRINSEIEGSRGRSPKPSAPGEPPAAIQNAMMTKDKKPFTYTPGGLDLSQIRSPRIQRRINRNMADEGVGALPAAAHQDHGPLPAAAQAAMQPNLPVQVLPPPPPAMAGMAQRPAPPPQMAAPYAPPLGAAQPSLSAQAVQMTAASLRPTGVAPLRQHEQPGGLYIAPVPAAAAAPPPQPQPPRSQLGSLYIPPVTDYVDASSPSSPPPPPQRQHFSPPASASPQAGLNKAPTPWMSSLQQAPAPQQQQPQYFQPRTPQSPAGPPQAPPQSGGARIIPIQIEGREPPQPASPQTPQEAHLSQWQREQQLRQLRQQQQGHQGQQGQQAAAPWRTAQHQAQQQQQQQQQSPSPQPQLGERVIPIQFETASNGAASPPVPRQPLQQHQQHQPHFQRRPMGPQATSGIAGSPGPQGGPQGGPHGGPEWGAAPPVQSQSFRVLQKITDDPRDLHQQPGRMNEMNAAQLRKLQLNDEDQALMNKFKAQVDGEVYLHQESDPRYRGAAIPSRAFRMLQNMTGEDDGSVATALPSRISPAVRLAQQAVQESAQPYVPPSEQTVQEPRKYTGGAIPSRSFRMLQAMTGSENCDPGDTSDL